MDVSPMNRTQEDTILETLDTDNMMQLIIGVEEDEEGMEEDDTKDEEKELMEDKL